MIMAQSPCTPWASPPWQPWPCFGLPAVAVPTPSTADGTEPEAPNVGPNTAMDILGPNTAVDMGPTTAPWSSLAREQRAGSSSSSRGVAMPWLSPCGPGRVAGISLPWLQKAIKQAFYNTRALLFAGLCCSAAMQPLHQALALLLLLAMAPCASALPPQRTQPPSCQLPCWNLL